ncbi:MAG: hypothetical protein B6I19_02670 [Bacteroidetes bacterium 4572_114]|nr:MAG: hypothetical protein B6I19_02670 [Bacteroidetes bacterium 4572_114]
MLYSPEPAEEYDLEVVYSQNMPNGMFFANEGLSAISHLKLSSSGIAGHASGISICPNPTNDIVWITSVKGFDEIAIINSSVSFFLYPCNVFKSYRRCARGTSLEESFAPGFQTS